MHRIRYLEIHHVCNVALQKLVKENKELRVQVEMYKAEAALRKFDVMVPLMFH